MSGTKARVAAVRYLNTAPLIEGLEKARGVSLALAVPSRIAGMVGSGEADVGLVSIVDALRGEVGLSLLPVGMIGCDGRTLTVRVYSEVAPGEIEVLHADGDSHTSVVLARVVLERVYGVRPRVEALDAGAMGGSWPRSMLLIGDKVVTSRLPAGRYAHEIDLGEAWKALTRLPFAYAMWACRSGEEGSGTVEWVSALLERQRLHNATRLDWIVERRAGAAGWPVELAREYLGRLLKYEVDDRAREGVERFAREAAGLGLVDRAEVPWGDAGVSRGRG